jgi:hypothetical protein
VPDQRRTHVKRFLAKTRGDDGEIVDVQGVWLDVQRRETMQMEEGSGFEYQQTIVELQHYDDESGEQPNKARVSHILKVVPPDEDDPDNPSLWWEIEVSDEITVRDADVEIKRRFDNSKNNETRREHVELRRVSHSDTPYDDDPKYDNGGIIQGYEKTPDTKDEGQYLDVEIIRNFSFDEFQPNKRLTPPWEFSQRTDVKLNNDDLIEDSDPIPADQNYEDDDINPPYRLDPFQNIVNMQYSPPERPVIGRSLYVGTGGDATSFTEVSNDKGESWETGFGDRTSTAASGLGLTVAGKGKHVVFGKPKDGAPCFIRATIFDFGDPDHPDQKIQRGVSDGDGGLKWSTVATVPADGRVVGLSFAGKAFFVAYQDSDEKAFALVSFNGENFAKVRTFSNVPSDNSQFQDRGNNPDAEAQSVAYDPVNKRYCTTGQFLRWYSFNIADPSDDPFIDTIPDTNFMWATSSDGVKWSAGYDTSQCVGAINDPPRDKSGIYCDPLYNSVAWGAGLFVAATAQSPQPSSRPSPVPARAPTWSRRSCAAGRTRSPRPEADDEAARGAFPGADHDRDRRAADPRGKRRLFGAADLEIFGVGHHSAAGHRRPRRAIAALPVAQRGPVLFNRVYGVGNPAKMREFNNTGPTTAGSTAAAA